MRRYGGAPYPLEGYDGRRRGVDDVAGDLLEVSRGLVVVWRDEGVERNKTRDGTEHRHDRHQRVAPHKVGERRRLGHLEKRFVGLVGCHVDGNGQAEAHVEERVGDGPDHQGPGHHVQVVPGEVHNVRKESVNEIGPDGHGGLLAELGPRAARGVGVVHHSVADAEENAHYFFV